MEDLEKELNDSCGCCPECNCGDDCHCTEDDKCCEECTFDTNCKCHDKECNCDDKCDCDDDCECDKNDKCNEQCDCAKHENDSCECGDKCDCGDECDCTEDDKCCDECDYAEEQEDDKCKCGCGENVEETTADAYFKQLLSLRAEFDNYRKRTQNDISKAYTNGFNQAITEFLPALDSFKMATEYITDTNTLMGIQYIEKGILSTLEKMGIQTIDATGKFNPDFHQAIDSEVSAEHESGDIIKECFKGFKMGDKIIRYAQVIVAK